MSDNFESSLINLGELSKPATVLVEKISDAVGGIFKPYQIVRVAKAEAQADRVRAEGQIEISDLHRRAFHRFLEEEAKKQRNIEEITQKALPLLKDDSKPTELEDDWIVNFFDRCRLISDEQMQGLWSRILAGETNAPGSYSKRTVGFLSNLDKREADLFTGLCGYMWTFRTNAFPVVFDDHGLVYDKHGINSGALIDLEGIGLIHYQSNGFSFRLPSEGLTLDYYGTKVAMKVRGGSIEIPTGKVIFTRVGKELAPICEGEPVEGLVDHVLRRWEQHGLIVESRSDVGYEGTWASLWNIASEED